MNAPAEVSVSNFTKKLTVAVPIPLIEPRAQFDLLDELLRTTGIMDQMLKPGYESQLSWFSNRYKEARSAALAKERT